MRYNEGLEPAMNDLSLIIQSGMKVGIVGRTGAGKSTILQVLFRLTDSFKGSIKIDGQDIKSIGLHLLRKSIAYIPQSPFLISGSIRDNLDPF
jgi:ABC-type multidrug transport system fused ATPase/permease subunit